MGMYGSKDNRESWNVLIATQDGPLDGLINMIRVFAWGSKRGSCKQGGKTVKHGTQDTIILTV
jgi:hypothetical protein